MHVPKPSARVSQRELVRRARAWVAPDGPATDGGPRIIRELPGFDLIQLLHQGGQGVVYLAEQRSTGREVAVKVLRGGAGSSVAERVRQQREVQILGQLRHPAIVTVHDSGVHNGVSYFVMDYIDGQPLDAYLAAAPPGRSERIDLFARIAEAVQAAHVRGVIHRDLKPANILVDREGNPHIVDFGLAKLDTGEGPGAAMTRTGQFVGSLPWSAPEQARGEHREIDVRTDVYALGVVFWHAVTGGFPYDVGGDVPSVMRNILEVDPSSSDPRRRPGYELETILRKCLAKQPDRRYQSAGALAADLRRLQDGRPIAARRDSTWYVLRKNLRRHWQFTTAAASIFVVVLASAIGFALMYRVAERARADAEQKLRAAEATLGEMRRGMFREIPPLPSFVDDFRDGQPDPRFVVEGTALERDGHLTLIGRTSYVLDPAHCFLRGDFDITVRFAAELPDLDSGAVHVGVWTSDPFSATPVIYISRYREVNPECEDWPSDRIQGVLIAGDCRATVTPYDLTDGRLRIVRRGTRGALYYWRDDAWQELATGAVPDTALGLGLFSSTFYTTNAATVSFSDFRVTTTFPPEPICLDDLADDFGGSVIDPRFQTRGNGYPLESGGTLRIRRQNADRDWAGCQLDPARFRLCGDFQLTITYNLASFPDEPAAEHRVGLAVLDATTLAPIAAVERVRTAGPASDLHRARFDDRPGAATDLSATRSTGRLRITRRGPHFTLAAYDGAWHELDTAHHPADPLIFRLYSDAEDTREYNLVEFDDLSLTTSD